MRWCLFNNGVAGHHPGYVAGIARAAAAVGVEVTVMAPHLADDVLDLVDFVPIEVHGLREIRKGRAILVDAVDRVGAVDLFCDLNLDKNVWVIPDELFQIPRRVHVLHHASQYSRGRRGLARIRTELAHRRIRRLARRGDSIVVHTATAAEYVRRSAEPRLLGYPVPWPVDPVVPVNRERPDQVLFVGAARPDKGLVQLAEAIVLSGAQISIRVIGPQPEGVPAELDSRFPDIIDWRTEFFGPAELRSHFETTALTVLPYQPTFAAHGGASSALLETVGFGVPIVTTMCMAEQLPEQYAGAMIAADSTAASLAASLIAGLDRVEQLRAGARSSGAAFIAERHTYRSYVAGLMAIAEG